MSSSPSQGVSDMSTPDSSPPPSQAGDSMEETKDSNVSEAMHKEELAIRKKIDKDERAHNERMANERNKLVKQGSEAVDKKFKALEYLLNQSKLYSNIMLSQMQQQEDKEAAKGERARKKAEKQEEAAEAAATQDQRRSTRNAAAPEGSSETTATDNRGRGRFKKSDAPSKQQSKLSSYLKKDAVAAKAGEGGVEAAMQEVADDGVKTGDVGYQAPKFAQQPSLVSGGTMRKYQLEGLEWLKSLYENGLNGILADEMGLGKTIQTISFLAFLREMDTYGPFLVVAPLSTTTNWVNEFKKWTPQIPVVLYHGDIPTRAELRAKLFKNPGSAKFPVVVTSYDICMNDQKHLAHLGWKFIIVDEGHRMKNHNCRLVRELQSYQSANRLLITGTPLQNDLGELWSLLNFLMPEIFDKLESFQSWFDFSELKQKDGYEQIFNEERKKTLVASLHAILKPFLLRRVKTDVEKLLPKKREYVLFAPLEPLQRELYQTILDGNAREYLEDKMFESLAGSRAATPGSTRGTKRKLLDVSGINTPNKSAKTSRATTPGSAAGSVGGRSMRSTRRQDYSEISDRKYFAELENESSENPTPSDSGDEEENIVASTLALAKRQIATKKLQNPMMQLRLCCDSPYNFYNPYLQADGEVSDPDETIVTTSGKMRLLDTLLPRLFAEGHKVLIFSQFKTQLDILENYAWLRNWACCRIDGSTPQTERAEQIDAFNAPSNKKDAANLFLLSTRAGGQGINLVAADTVVLYDSDWNPQQDLQAQDRAHRIGQTRNVIVYRLATRGTVEQGLLEKAEGKRRLEKLVIQKGGATIKDSGARKDTLEELRDLLSKTDGEHFEVAEGELLSEHDLKILTDRSEEAYVRAEKGQDVGAAFKAVDNRITGGLLEKFQS